MSSLTLQPRTRAQGTVVLPGSKSLSNRILLLAALAQGSTQIEGLLESDDTRHLRAALTALGLQLSGATTVSGDWSEVRSADLYLGNAGTAFRPLTAVLACTPGEFIIRGEERMHERPMGPLVDALRGWGADIEYLENEGFAPLRIRGKRLAGGATQVDGSLSSQFLTALLMAAPLLQREGSVEVVGEMVSQPYIDMTIGQMAQFGVSVERSEDGRSYRVQPQSYLSPGQIFVEGDATAASYFMAMGAIGGGPVRIEGAGRDSVQGEIAFAQVVEAMGARVEWGSTWLEVSAPENGGLKAVQLDLNAIPDSAMTLAVLALFAEGQTEIRGVGNWRVKECDRQQALAEGLRALGAEVELIADGVRVSRPEQWRSARINTYNDHRIAMCFSLASFGPVPVEIGNPECVSKTFPHYFAEFDRLSQRSH